MLGNSSVIELSNALSKPLDVAVDVTATRANEARDIEARSANYRIDEADGAAFGDGTYDQLMASLVPINSFAPMVARWSAPA